MNSSYSFEVSVNLQSTTHHFNVTAPFEGLVHLDDKLLSIGRKESSAFNLVINRLSIVMWSVSYLYCKSRITLEEL